MKEPSVRNKASNIIVILKLFYRFQLKHFINYNHISLITPTGQQQETCDCVVTKFAMSSRMSEKMGLSSQKERHTWYGST